MSEYWRREANRQAAWADFLRADSGHPLGHGMPTGSPLREDGDSHRMGWIRVVRLDPCAYCNSSVSGTVDHIDARNARSRKGNHLHTWLNFTGACESCNTSKRDEPLLSFLARRRVIVREGG